jgi:hypothetical protein
MMPVALLGDLQDQAVIAHRVVMAVRTVIRWRAPILTLLRE